MNYIYKIIRSDDEKATDIKDLTPEEQERIKSELSQRLADQISIILARG